jgi:DNA adenine methylase
MELIHQSLHENNKLIKKLHNEKILLMNRIKCLYKCMNELNNTLNLTSTTINYTNIKNKSPLRYPGGKTRACKKLEEIILKYFNINNIHTIYSPFFGGGSFEFYIQNSYKINIICNDKFSPLYNFWNNCKNNKQELCDKLYKKLSVSKKEFSEYRSKIMKETNSLNRAYYYFIINRCSFSGATLSGGFSEEASKKRFTKTSIDRVNNLNLEKFDISNEDFEDFIKKKCINNNSIIFLDPPYYLGNKSKLYGNNGDMHEHFNHDKLYNILKQKKCWIMTYNNCEYIKNLYKDFTIIDVDWSYGMNKSKKSSELVILHSDFTMS